MNKKCDECQQVLPIECFYFYKSWGSYGTECKECHKGKLREQYKRRRDKVLQTRHAYVDANRDLIRLKERKKYRDNATYRSGRKAYQVEYRKNHADKKYAYNAAYRAKNRETLNKYRREYAKTGAGKILDKRHDCKRRAARKNANLIGQHTHEEWLQVLAMFGNSCAACGSKQDITQDHIIPISKGGSDNITNIQPLCRRCNSSKRASILKVVQKSMLIIDGTEENKCGMT